MKTLHIIGALLAISISLAGCAASQLSRRIQINKSPNLLIAANAYETETTFRIIGNVRRSIGLTPSHGYMKACVTWASGISRCKEQFMLLNGGRGRREFGFSIGFKSPDRDIEAVEVTFMPGK
jgi:hypothetical protein